MYEPGGPAASATRTAAILSEELDFNDATRGPRYYAGCCLIRRWTDPKFGEVPLTRFVTTIVTTSPHLRHQPLLNMQEAQPETLIASADLARYCLIRPHRHPMPEHTVSLNEEGIGQVTAPPFA
jgi:hypothetical protein